MYNKGERDKKYEIEVPKGENVFQLMKNSIFFHNKGPFKHE